MRNAKICHSPLKNPTPEYVFKAEREIFVTQKKVVSGLGLKPLDRLVYALSLSPE